MAVYSIDIRLYATAYIKAETAEEAQKIADGLAKHVIEVREDDFVPGIDDPRQIYVTGADFRSAGMPPISIGPVMTSWGPDDHEKVELVGE